MKLSDDKKLDQAERLWLRQKRMEWVPISGPLLCDISRILNGEIETDVNKQQ